MEEQVDTESSMSKTFSDAGIVDFEIGCELLNEHVDSLGIRDWSALSKSIAENLEISPDNVMDKLDLMDNVERATILFQSLPEDKKEKFVDQQLANQAAAQEQNEELGRNGD